MSTGGRTGLDCNAGLTQGPIGNGLEQVREILYGPQNRNFARRLARTDARISAQAEELGSEMRRRLEVLETHVHKESEALIALMDNQESTQTETLNTLARESREAIALLEQRVKKLEEGIARAHRDFGQQILDQAKVFIDEVRRMRHELRTAFEHELAAVQDEVDETAEPAESAVESSTEESSRHEQLQPISDAA
jgi:hypothetical protein